MLFTFLPRRCHIARRSVLLLWFIAFCKGAWNDCALDQIMADESVPDLGDFWNEHVRGFSKLHIDTGADMEDGRFFSRWALLFTASDELLSRAVGNCLFGVLTILLNAIPTVEYEHGREEALGLLDVALSIMRQASKMDNFSNVVDEAETLGWMVAPINSTLELYQGLLGELLASKTTGCGGLKFYVYPPPQSLIAAQQKDSPAKSTEPASLLRRGDAQDYLDALGNGPLQCLFGMYGTELLYHMFFSSSSCRTWNPDEADFFFVPSFFKCIEVINYADHFNEGRTGEDEAGALFRQTLAYVQEAGRFQRYDGADHIFLFSWGRFPCRLPDWRTSIRSAVALQVEDCCEDLNTEPRLPSFSRWKDILIPGHVDKWRALEARRHNLPMEHRDILISFHGRHGGNTDSYENVSVRARIVSLIGLPGVSIGGFIKDYHQVLGRSVFCLAPRGITPWTIHLYIAVLAGCVPVILSDDFELPFQELVDWPSFSIRWPESMVDDELYTFLATLPMKQVQEMKKRVDEHACWFDYYAVEEDCSPYAGVLRALRRRREQRPAYAGKAWVPPEQSEGENGPTVVDEIIGRIKVEKKRTEKTSS